MKKSAWLALALVTGIVLLQCSDRSIDSHSFQLDEPISLRMGASAKISPQDLEVTFDRVNFDSRCLQAAVCDIPGIAEIDVQLQLPENPPCLIRLAIPSITTANDVEYYSVDTLGYRFRLMQLSQFAQSNPDAIATIAVSSVVDVGQKPISAVCMTDSLPESIFLSQYKIVGLGLIGDTLSLVVKFAGGCRTHYFWLVMSPGTISAGNPPHAELYLRHLDPGDECGAEISRQLRFNISALREQFEHEFSSPLWMRLNLHQMAGAPDPNAIEVLYGDHFTENHKPEIQTVADTTMREGEIVVVQVRTFDPDGQVPDIYAYGMPSNCTFLDNNSGTGFLTFRPDYTQAGEYTVGIVATDTRLADTAIVNIGVANVNRQPQLAPISDKAVRCGNAVTCWLAASDPDGDSVRFSVTDSPLNSTLQQLTDSTCRFDFSPIESQIGEVHLTAIASDGELADTGRFVIQINPALSVKLEAPEGTQYVTEGDTLEFALTAIVSEPLSPSYSFECEPSLSPFVRVSPRGQFVDCFISPGLASSGSYELEFRAKVENVAATAVVSLVVLESGNHAPVWAPRSAYESIVAGGALAISVAATDPDGTPPTLSAQNLIPGATFIETEPGKGKLELAGGSSLTGIYDLEFVATDAQDASISLTQHIRLNVSSPESSSGSLMPAALGNYWIVERTATQDCFTGEQSNPPNVRYPTRGTVTEDSIWISEQINFAGYSWWKLSDNLDGFGQIFRESNDTVYASTLGGTEFRIFYPVSSSQVNYPNAILVGSVAAPAGAYTQGYSYNYQTTTAGHSTRLVPGIGFLSMENRDDCPFVHSCSQFGGCNYHLSVKLLRFGTY